MIDWNDVGNRLHLEKDRPTAALSAYRRAMVADPRDPRPWNGLGILLADRLGRPDDAEAAFRRAIALDPGFAAPWNGLGIFQQDELCRPDLAYGSFLKAIERDRADPTYWYNLACLLRTWYRDCAGAERACRTGLALAPDDPFLWLAWGDLALIRGEREIALQRLERAAHVMAERIDPQAAILSLSLATGLGHGADAARWAGAVTRLATKPARPVEAAVTLAIHALAVGDPARAEQWSDTALGCLGRHHRRLWALAECYGTAGLRPDLRDALAGFARRLFAAPQRPGLMLAGTAPPAATLHRFHRFAFSGGRGAGDPLDRRLWCREGEAAWLPSPQELARYADGFGEADALDGDAGGEGAVQPTRH